MCVFYVMNEDQTNMIWARPGLIWSDGGGVVVGVCVCASMCVYGVGGGVDGAGGAFLGGRIWQQACDSRLGVTSG